jgi:hypothetical protein
MAHIVISGDEVRSEDASRTGLSNVSFDLDGFLAARPGTVRVRKRDGRGEVTVLQQPSRVNGFTAIVQVYDTSSGADNYEIDIDW